MIIHDPQLRLLILAEIVRDPAAGGLAGEDRARLRGLSFEQLERLSRLPHPMLAIAFEPRDLAVGLAQLEHVVRATHDEEYFLTHGASARMMHALFRMAHHDAARRRRELLGPDAPMQRRPRMPPMAERERMQAWWWQQTSGRKATATDYIAMHRAFPEWTFATLDAVVHQDLDDEDPPADPRQVAGSAA